MAWGQSPIAWLWLGVRQHCSAEPGLMWQPCTRVSSMSVAAPMLVLVSPEWGCGKGAPPSLSGTAE